MFKFQFQAQVCLQASTRQPSTFGQASQPSTSSPQLFPSLPSSSEMKASKQVTPFFYENVI